MLAVLLVVLLLGLVGVLAWNWDWIWCWYWLSQQ
jgi:hypothetical protein